MRKIKKVMILFFALIIFYQIKIAGAEKVKVGYGFLAGAMLPVWVTYESGIFEKYNIRTSLFFLQGAKLGVASLASGEVEIFVIAPAGFIIPLSEGFDFVVFLSLGDKLRYVLMSQPNITNIEELKGKKIAISGIGGLDDIVLRFSLKKLGLDPEKDVFLLGTGDHPTKVNALRSGAVNATIVTPPSNFILQKAGFKSLIKTGDLNIPYVGNAIWSTRKYIQNNPDKIERFSGAVIEGIKLSKLNKEQALKVITKYMKTKDREILEWTYQDSVMEGLQEKPYVSLEGVRFLISAMSERNPKMKNLDPSRFVDNSFIKKLDASGFIDRLYR